MAANSKHTIHEITRNLTKQKSLERDQARRILVSGLVPGLGFATVLRLSGSLLQFFERTLVLFKFLSRLCQLAFGC